MQINFTVFATGVILSSNKLRYKAYEASAPTAEVASVTEDPPHTFPHAVTLNVPNPVVHIVKIYSTPDASSGTLISEFIYDPTFTNVEVRLPLQILVGGTGTYDPEADTKDLDIPFLTEWEGLWTPERRANGGTMADFEYTIKPTGGLTLVGDDTFAENELLWIHFEPKVSVSQPTFNYINLFNSVVYILASRRLDSNDFRKAIQLYSLDTTVYLTLPKLADTPDMILLPISTMMGNQRQCIVQSDQPGEFININNGQSSSICLGRNEKLWLLKTTTSWEVVEISEGVFKVGSRGESDVLFPNTTWADGGTLLGSDYVRLKNYVSSLPAGYVMTAAQKTSGDLQYAGYWGYDLSSDTIYKPDYRGLAKRDIPGTSGRDSGRDNNTIPGHYQRSIFPDHKHMIIVSGNYSSNQDPYQSNRNPDINRSMKEGFTKTSGTGRESMLTASGLTDEVPNIGPTSGVNGNIVGTNIGNQLTPSNIGIRTLIYI
jgi:hypothetical protein